MSLIRSTHRIMIIWIAKNTTPIINRNIGFEDSNIDVDLVWLIDYFCGQFVFTR